MDSCSNRRSPPSGPRVPPATRNTASPVVVPPVTDLLQTCPPVARPSGEPCLFFQSSLRRATEASLPIPGKRWEDPVPSRVAVSGNWKRERQGVPAGDISFLVQRQRSETFQLSDGAPFTTTTSSVQTTRRSDCNLPVHRVFSTYNVPDFPGSLHRLFASGPFFSLRTRTPFSSSFCVLFYPL